MLYVSTRNFNDSYTAHRALREEHTPNGGFYVPMRLPVFSPEEIAAIKSQTCSETIAQMLSLFSGLQISAWDVECAIGRSPIKLQTVNQKVVIAELWHNPDNDSTYLLSILYGLLLGEKGIRELPVGWPRIAAEIALLFGVYSVIDCDVYQCFDVAASTDDAATMAAVIYAKNMGLPVNLLICACCENSVIWDLVSRNDFFVRDDQPRYLEYLIYSLFGESAVLHYFCGSEQGVPFVTEEATDENETESANGSLYAAVVSDSRIDTITSGMYSTNKCNIDPATALAYGSLQDYRAQTGISKDTVILSKQRAK